MAAFIARVGSHTDTFVLTEPGLQPSSNGKHLHRRLRVFWRFRHLAGIEPPYIRALPANSVPGTPPLEANMPRVVRKPPQSKPLKKGAKIQFVRSLPMDMPAAEVVALAAAEGIVLNPHGVHGFRTEIRVADRKRNAQKIGSATKPLRAAAPSGKILTKPNKTTSVEDLLRAVAGEIGLGRAIAILEEQRQAVRTALRG